MAANKFNLLKRPFHPEVPIDDRNFITGNELSPIIIQHPEKLGDTLELLERGKFLKPEEEEEEKYVSRVSWGDGDSKHISDVQ